MAKRTASKLKEQVPPSQRLAVEREVETQLKQARDLLYAKKYKEAFKQYKQALVSANGIVTFARVSEMEKLAKHYRPALIALKQWRSQKEKLIFAGTADSTVISEWRRLNDCLNDKGRVLMVFRKLREAQADEEILHRLYWAVWRQLVREKQYEELRQFFRTLAWSTMLAVSGHQADKWFPRDLLDQSTPESIIKDGAPVYETALALNEIAGANVILEKLLSVDNSDATYAALITAARRARAPEQAKKLFQEARATLGPYRFRKSRKALGNLAARL